MSPLVGWALIVIAGAGVLAVAMRVDSWAWHVREAREEKRLRAELQALRRMQGDKG